MPDSQSNSQGRALTMMIRDWIPTWDNLDSPCGAKDLESRIRYANPAYKRLLALPPGFKVEGLLDHELPSPTSQFAEQFRHHDRLVEKTGERKSSLEINEFGPGRELSAYFFDKVPIYGHEKNILGTFFFGRKAMQLTTDFYISGEKVGTITLAKPSDLFTDREWEVIFLLMQKLSVKQIAAKINRSVNTVRTHLTSVKNKAGVDHTRQLIALIIEKGWQNYIPEKYLQGRRYLLING